MKSYQETQDAVKKAIAEFPSVFGLTTCPGEIFRISEAHSYFNDHDELMLYTEIKKKGQWLSYAKGSVHELRHYVRELKMSVAEQCGHLVIDKQGRCENCFTFIGGAK